MAIPSAFATSTYIPSVLEMVRLKIKLYGSLFPESDS